MKKEIRYAVFVLSTIIFAATYFNAQDNSLPTLQGDAAVERLKQTGQYDSLMKAVRAARKQDGFADFPSSESAVAQTAKLTASDGANGDDFGTSVAIEGNTAIAGAAGDDVGANTAQGSVYVFVRNGTTWTEQQKLTASDGAADDLFGASVALSGDTLVVGAYQKKVGANNGQGSVYVFVRTGGVWTEQQKLVASDGAQNDEFGRSVAIEGNTIIAGAFGHNFDRGAAYVFLRSGTTWTLQQKLTASDPVMGDHFYSVAIQGDTVFVGAPWHDVFVESAGLVYVFVRSGTVWTETQRLFASDGGQFDNFGYGGCIAIDGDTLVIGARSDDIGGNFDQGSAYVFVRSGGVWSQQQKLVGADFVQTRNFGSVALEGDTLVVGAYQTDVGNTAQGTAYVFTRSGTTWTQRQKLFASDGEARDYFGYSTAISDHKILVGAPGTNRPMQNDVGAAFVFIAQLSVSGRIMTAGGGGIANASVQVTLADGSTLTARSSSFGYYTVEGIEADQTVTISVGSKRYQFTPQMVNVNGNLTNVDFIAQ